MSSNFFILISAVLISTCSVVKGQGCLDSTQCRVQETCYNFRCQSTQSECSRCGTGAICNRGICKCPNNFIGSPYTECRPSGCVIDRDCPACGQGQITKCSVINGVSVCTCLATYTGSSLTRCLDSTECRFQEKCNNFRCQSAQSECSPSCGTDAICHRGVCECPNGFVGNPFTECRPECIVDRDCPGDRPTCVYDVCKNPCDDACGSGADCSLRGLTAVCSCPRDMAGDPLVRCRTVTKEDLCNPNPCGTNAECASGYDKQNRQRPVCTCRAGYTGNPLSNCSRVSFRVSRERDCEDDSECSDHTTCYNNQCVDACINQCGDGAICEAKRHIAACSISF